MKISVLGAGQLGSWLYKALAEDGFDVVQLTRADGDFTDSSFIEKIVKSSDTIVNCIAYTDVDKAETEPLKASSANLSIPSIIASQLIFSSKKFIHISTEYVYGSMDLSYAPLREDCPMAPQNVYATTKAGADTFITTMIPVMLKSKLYVLRPSWLFGPGSSHNFFWKIRQKLEKDREAKVVDDQVGSMTSVFLLSEVIEGLARRDDIASGVYNVANDGFASRFDQALALAEEWPGLKDTKITRCKTADFKRKTEVPMNSCLDCSKIKKALGISSFRSWREDLKKYVEEELRCQDQRQ